ncbi:conserved hypothetical protein [Rippkaea orientalis PCC 8801]|uniref:Uncharacterized protein n=1 Tax=Rippkaea orientalis (strain PCC 8801 / RF-1) TaxID=41431 RepID=B7JZ09_RIPO1|nr:hypothetical protein [Rippkaea orientalis]ACK66086.1 conserved hypothetical protein [Rippkaea orientalis PCC 8801]
MTRKILQPQTYRPYLRRNLKLLLIFLLSISLILGGGQLKWQPVNAQTLRPENAAAMVYEQLSYLPKENQYFRQDTGEIDPEHTLISRFIRYHQDLKRRSNQVRLDWRITLADYLGVNESMKSDRYPGNTTLKTNPMEADIAVIRSLNRRQRQELVDLLVSLYTPKPQRSPQGQTSTDETVEPSTPRPAVGPGLSKPGDANLLAP